MITEDFGVYFNTADFAENVTLGTGTLTGIWDEPYELSLGEVSANVPQLRCETAALLAIDATPVGATLTRSGTDYVVREHVRDGTGTSILLLELA